MSKNDTLNPLLELFNPIIKNPDIKTYCTESTWWNGHCSMPLYSFKFVYKYSKEEIIILCEIRVNEFSKPNISAGAFNDINIISLNSSIKLDDKISSFKVVRKNLIQKFFDKSSNKLFKANSKNEKISLFLDKNRTLYNVFKKRSHANFSPSIIGENKGNYYRLTITYSIQKVDIELLNDFISFMKETISFLKTIG